MIIKKPIKGLAIAGCGTSLYAFLGAIYKLEENNLLRDIKYFSGCSAGSLLCFLLCIGYNYKTLKEEIINTPIDNLFIYPKNYVGKFLNCFNNKSICTNKGLYDFLKKILKKNKLKNNITYQQLYNKTKKQLFVVSTNLINKKEKQFSCDLTPNAKVIDSIVSSMSIPFVFPPIEYNNCLLVDGGLVDNFPMDILYKILNKNEILGLRLYPEKIEDNDQEHIKKNIQHYGEAIFNTLFVQKDNMLFEKYNMQRNTIFIDSKNLGTIPNKFNRDINYIESVIDYNIKNINIFVEKILLNEDMSKILNV